MGLIKLAAGLSLLLCFKDECFQLGRSLQSQHGRFGVLVVVLESKFNALPFKSARVRLNLHVLLKQTVDRLLRFMQLHGRGRLCVQFELLLDGFG